MTKKTLKALFIALSFILIIQFPLFATSSLHHFAIDSTPTEEKGEVTLTITAESEANKRVKTSRDVKVTLTNSRNVTEVYEVSLEKGKAQINVMLRDRSVIVGVFDKQNDRLFSTKFVSYEDPK